MLPISRRTALAVLPAGLCLGPMIGAHAAAQSYDDARSVYAALRGQPGTTLPVAGGRIKLVFADGAPGLDRARVTGWVGNAAKALIAYFGRFPVADYSLLVVADDGARVGHATTWGFDGSVTRVEVGTEITAATLANDWVLVHEMVHTALPIPSRDELWLLEGNATYVEPIARAQAGLVSPDEVWRWALTGLPRALRAQDGGLGGTEDHDRLYWGGALFWMLAEVAIHDRTSGRRSLRDALRAINRKSGGNRADWSGERIMAEGDAAIGAAALTPLYRAMRDRAADVDLPDLFSRLGVARGDGVIVYDDRARLAPLRRAITRR